MVTPTLADGAALAVPVQPANGAAFALRYAGRACRRTRPAPDSRLPEAGEPSSAGRCPIRAAAPSKPLTAVQR